MSKIQNSFRYDYCCVIWRDREYKDLRNLLKCLSENDKMRSPVCILISINGSRLLEYDNNIIIYDGTSCVSWPVLDNLKIFWKVVKSSN